MENSNTLINPIINQETLQKILSGRVVLRELNFENRSDRATALESLRTNGMLVQSLDTSNDKQCLLVKDWISKKASRVQYLLSKQLNEEIIDTYIYARLKEGELVDNNNTVRDFSTVKSFDNKTLIKWFYSSSKEEMATYFDKALGIPTNLKFNLGLTIKIEEAFTLIKKLDVSLDFFGLNHLKNALTEFLTISLRDVTINYIDKNGMSYYDLSKHYKPISDCIVETLGKELSSYGLSISNFYIKDIVVPNNTSELLENQFFTITKERVKKQFEEEIATRALENYEKKAEIHSKYPNFPMTLTEAEKDRALSRYLLKIGEDVEDTVQIEHENISLRKETFDKKLDSVKCKGIEIAPPQKNKVRSTYILLIVIGLAVGALTMIASTVAGFIIIGLVILIGGLFATFKYDLLKEKYNPEDKEAYEKTMTVISDQTTKDELISAPAIVVAEADPIITAEENKNE